MSIPIIDQTTRSIISQLAIDLKPFQGCICVYHYTKASSHIYLEETATEIILHLRRFQIRGLKAPSKS